MITRLTAAAGLLALSPGLALAQMPTATPAEPATKADSNMKEWQVAKVAKVGLAQALATAESQGDEKGGRAIDADFEKADGKNPTHWSIKVVYPDGKLVVAGSAAGEIAAWPVGGDKRLFEVQMSRPITAVALDDHKRLFGAADDHHISIWNLPSKEEPQFLATYLRHRHPVRSIFVAADGKRALSVADDLATGLPPTGTGPPPTATVTLPRCRAPSISSSPRSAATGC